MDLNPVFTSPTAFRPATTGGELALFASAGIALVHGWLVDSDSPEHAAVSRVQDYDSAVNLIVEADVLTRGMLVGNGNADDDGGAGPSQAGSSSSNINLTDEEMRKVEDGEYRTHVMRRAKWVLMHEPPSRRDPGVPRQHALTTDLQRFVHTRLSSPRIRRFL
jgi:hypothetical protein